MTRNFLVVVNPIAGSKNKKQLVERSKAFLDAQHISHNIYYTNQKGHANNIIKENLTDEVTDILVIGGDGTLNEVVNGLMKANKTLPISIIPTGTGNDFIKSIPFGKTLDQQLETALNGKELAVDLGCCNGRYFHNTMGFGFDGKVVEIMEKNGKKLTGHLAYLYTVLRTVTNFKEPKLTFQIDDNAPREENIFLMAINNGTTYGGGFKITPKAQVNDGVFDVCLIKKISVWRRYLNLPKLQKGTHEKVKEIEFLTCKKLKIDFAHNIHAHVDGEYIGPPPYHVTIYPQKQVFRVLN